ncbi:MAG TPA: hypothetical protein VFW19_04405 [Allosphingosinicella sp.]|nr:hypothetical protein [Allosphingosinicella sp.]
MRKAIMLAAAILPTACSRLFDPPEVAKCEKYVTSKLDRPDSYRRGRHTSLSLGQYWEVGIEYSYVDRNGAARSRAWEACDYPIVDGKADTSKFLHLSGGDGKGQSKTD